MGIPIQCGVPQCCIRQVACSVLRYGQETASYRRQTYQVLLLPQTQLYQAEILQLFHTLAPPEKKELLSTKVPVNCFNIEKKTLRQ